MSPIRIVILAILFYILYRLLTGGKKKTSVKNTAGGELPAQDILVEDPVCHTYIPKQQAVSAKHNGTVYYFCSKECCEKHIATNRGEK